MRIIILVAFCAFVSSSLASTATGVVSQLRAAESSPLIIFKVEGEANDMPRCNESGSYSFRFDSPGGTAILEILKISMLEKRPVRVVGLNTCSRGYKSEGVQEVQLG